MRRIHIVLFLLVLSFLLALATGSSLYYRLLILSVLILTTSWLWSFFSSKGIDIRFDRKYGGSQVGDHIESYVTIRNRTFLPKLGMEIVELDELPGHHAGAIINLAPREEKTLSFVSPLNKRGEYTISGPKTYSPEPFGVISLRSGGIGSQQLVVFPRMFDVPNMALFSEDLAGDGTMQRSDPLASTSVATIRDYIPGESAKHLHWPSIARSGKLVVKQFDTGMENTVWVIIDMHDRVHVGDYVNNTEELAMTAAASIIKSCSERAQSVGLFAIGESHYSLPPQRGTEGLNRCLLALAQMKALGSVPLDEALGLWRSYTPSSQDSNIIVITPSISPDWVNTLKALSRQSGSSKAVLIDPYSFLDYSGTIPAIQQLQADDIQVFSLGKCDDVIQALSQPTRSSAVILPREKSQILENVEAKREIMTGND